MRIGSEVTDGILIWTYLSSEELWIYTKLSVEVGGIRKSLKEFLVTQERAVRRGESLTKAGLGHRADDDDDDDDDDDGADGAVRDREARSW